MKLHLNTFKRALPIPIRIQSQWLLIIGCLLILSLAGCYQPMPNYDPWKVPQSSATVTLPTGGATFTQTQLSPTPAATLTPAPTGPTPTPNLPAALPTLRSQETEYTVQEGDSLARIALKHQVSVAQILQANPEISDPNLIEPEQKLLIPPASANELAPDFKIIPDAELFNSPSAVGFDTQAIVTQFGGKLASYSEELEDGTKLSGAQIVQKVAEDFSVNPRLLLVVLEDRSGWLTGAGRANIKEDYPLGLQDANRKGLYKQLSWAANEMTRGYTLWSQAEVAVWTLADGTVLRIAPTIDGGTAGVQYMLGLLLGKEDWKQAVSENGLYATYLRLFGFPFAFAIEPLIPEDLVQPELILPFKPGETWYFTGGPHAGWGTGSAWAGIDFAPAGEEYGCYESQSVVVAATDGVVVRVGDGVLVQDLDVDGIEQTGWSLLYLHLDKNDDIQVGTYLHRDDPIGYPSCEGGYTTGTHLHLARRYNGVWIAADGEIPFVLSGWVASSTGIEYDGFLTKDGQTVEAFNGRADLNEIAR